MTNERKARAWLHQKLCAAEGCVHRNEFDAPCGACVEDAAVLTILAVVRAKGEEHAADLQASVEMLKQWPIHDRPSAVEALEDAATDVQARAADVPEVQR